MRNKRSLWMICIVLIFSMMLVGCGKKEEAKDNAKNNAAATENKADNKTENKAETNQKAEAEPAADATEVSISEWEGAWNNMNAYLDDEELAPAFETVAKRDGISAEEAKSQLKEKRLCDFDGFVVEGDKVTFLDGFQDKGGKEIDSANYTYVESHEVQHGSSTLEWDVFKADKDDAKYPILLMMPIHGEESLIHFHMRYGDDAEALLAKEGWYPTFVKPSTTMEQLTDEITE